ncbi:hypothetical protein FD754_004518 [Muntiacus muntjak]|uniref:CFA20 domain-containing protein n=1 Tax=Muntiacus muntjak TaxID=9888 RepID=A0A5N3WF45_MUNMU|nr:hypothetical protein FD754_004518 [Muntiacus muntjak]
MSLNKLQELHLYEGVPGGSVVKNPPAKQEIRVRSLSWEDPLENGDLKYYDLELISLTLVLPFAIAQPLQTCLIMPGSELRVLTPLGLLLPQYPSTTPSIPSLRLIQTSPLTLLFLHSPSRTTMTLDPLWSTFLFLIFQQLHNLASMPCPTLLPTPPNRWCNLCIDLVAFTNEIFKGAVFQSLDGITVSANCKLRKIFTLKYKPQDTADKDAGHDAPFPTDEPIDIIPRSCQLTTDVPQVTQLLNMTKLRQTEIKFGGHPLSSAESDQFINRGTVRTRNSKHQDVCHIAFGSKVLGPPPLSGRRNNMRLSNETVRSVGSKSNRSHQQSTVEKCVNSAEISTLLLPESEAQRDKENIGQIKQTVPVLASLHIMHPHPPQEPSADKNNNRRRFRLKSTSGERTETPSGNSSEDNRNDEHKAATVLTTMSQQRAETLNPCSPVPQSPDQADEWVFPKNGDDIPYLASTTQSLLLDEDSCHTSCLCLEASKESEHDQQTEETQIVPKDVFTFSSRPRAAPHGRTQSMSPEACLFTLDLKEDTSVTRSDTRTEEDFHGGDSSEEDNHSVQGSPGPTTSPPELTQLTLESVLGKAAKCASKGYLKNAYAEGRTSENQNSMAKQIDIKDFETSFVPIPSLSPPGRHEYSPKIPDPIIKAKDLPAHQVSTSINKTFLKEVSEEKLKPTAELSITYDNVDILIMLILPICEHGISSHLCVSSSTSWNNVLCYTYFPSRSPLPPPSPPDSSGSSQLILCLFPHLLLFSPNLRAVFSPCL